MYFPGSIDFMQHYRLVNPAMIEAYAKAFVVEDGDLDTVINMKVTLLYHSILYCIIAYFVVS